ncbi:MAG: porin family protein [Bacteroidales bacterium]|nr:porin family protein [Bacteroidales bacterium]
MKKRSIFVMAAIVLCCVTAKAQNYVGEFSIMPKVGFISSSLTNMPNIDFPEVHELKKGFAPGFIVGAEVEYQVAQQVSVAAGLNYSLQGNRWKNFTSAALDIKDTKLVLGYINLPIVTNIYLFDGFAIKAGIQLGYLTNAHIQSSFTGRYGGTILSENVDESIMYDTNKLDVSIPMGISYEFDNALVLDARYNLGLTRVNKLNDPNEKAMKNSVFVISLGYKFPL